MPEEQTCLLGGRGEKSVEVSCSLLHEFSSQSFPDSQLQGLQKLSNSILFLLSISFILLRCFIVFAAPKQLSETLKSSLMSGFFYSDDGVVC